MVLSIFENKNIIPTDEGLVSKLRKTYKLWNTIKEYVFQNFEGISEEWKYGGKNYGWGFRLRDKKRVVIYMAPCDGYFKVSLVFGEKATKEALTSNISKEIRTVIESAPVYAEGRGFRIDVKESKIINDIIKLIEVKQKIK